MKLEDGAQHKNLRVWSVATCQEVIAFTQKSADGWSLCSTLITIRWLTLMFDRELQFTPSEDRAIRLVGPEVQVFNPADWTKAVVDRLKVEGISAVSLSPGRNPSLAVFVGEKKVTLFKLYPLLCYSRDFAVF